MTPFRLFLAGSLVSLTVAAQALGLDATIGFSGFVKQNRWTPVFVEMENLPQADKPNAGPKNIDGDLALVPNGSTAGRTLVMRPVQLPANDRKRVTLYAYFPLDVGKHDLLLTDKSGRILEPCPVSPRLELDRAARLAVTIRTSEMRSPFMRLRDLPPIHSAQLPPDHLPDQWYGYDSADIVIIPRVTDALFTEETAQALMQWVAQGGTLLMVGGRYGSTFVGSPLDGLMPCDVDGAEPYLLADKALVRAEDPQSTASGAFAITQVTLREKARVLLRMGEVPLLVERAHGSGSVLFTTCDWDAEMLAASNLDLLVGTTILSAHDMGSLREGFIGAVAADTAGLLGLGNAAKLPPNTVIMGILLGYFVLVGPLNFLILYRRKRLELAWVTVPVIVALFSGGIYAYSYFLKGSDTVFRTFHLLTGTVGSDTFRADSVSLLFVQQTAKYSISCPKSGVAMTPLGSAWNAISPDALSKGAIMIRQSPTGDMALPEKPVAQWSTDFTRLASVAGLDGTVECELETDGPIVTGWLANRTAKPLYSPVLFVGHQGANLLLDEDSTATAAPAPVHTVASGERIRFTLDPSRPAARNTEDFMTNQMRAGKNSGPPFIAGSPLFPMSDPLVWTLVEGHGYPDPSCVLLFTTEAVPCEPTVNAPVSAGGTRTGVALRVPLRSSEPVPPRSVWGEWKSVDGKEPAPQNQYSYSAANQPSRIQLFRQTAIAELRLPEGDADALETTGTLIVSSNSKPSGPLGVELSVYDFLAHRWEQLPSPPMQDATVPNTMGNRYTLEFDLTGVEHTRHPVTGAVWMRVAHNPDGQNAVPVEVLFPQLMGLDRNPPVDPEDSHGMQI